MLEIVAEVRQLRMRGLIVSSCSLRAKKNPVATREILHYLLLYYSNYSNSRRFFNIRININIRMLILTFEYSDIRIIRIYSIHCGSTINSVTRRYFTKLKSY